MKKQFYIKKSKEFIKQNNMNWHIQRQKSSVCGFTIIETMISMTILILALFGVSLVYNNVSDITEVGIRSETLEIHDIQTKSISSEIFISRTIRLASWADVENGGDTINLNLPDNWTKETFITSRFWFEDYNVNEDVVLGSIHYDPDITVNGDEQELYTNIFKIDEDNGPEPIFIQDQNLPRVININFGYFKGNEFIEENKRKVNFNITVRNVI